MKSLAPCLVATALALFAASAEAQPSSLQSAQTPAEPVAASPSLDAVPAQAEAPAPVERRRTRSVIPMEPSSGIAPERMAAGQTADVVRIAVLLTLLGLIPAMAICMTPFIRIVVVLSMIRHAFGMPETPPNPVLVSIALFLTAFIMAPTLSVVNAKAVQPFLGDQVSVRQALTEGSQPLKAFMLRQVHDQDIKTVYEIARRPLPARAVDVGLLELTTAYMLNELRVAFRIGFVLLLPFLLIDIVVSSVLLALGMMMVPPTTISLPIKVLMFVLVDGWGLILGGVASSFR